MGSYLTNIGRQLIEEGMESAPQSEYDTIDMTIDVLQIIKSYMSSDYEYSKDQVLLLVEVVLSQLKEL